MTRTQRTLQLGAFADGELEPSQRASVEQHLLAHPEAAIDVEQRRGLRVSIHKVYQSTSVPEQFRRHMGAMLHRERLVTRTRGLRLVIAGSFAAAALIMLAVTVGGPSFLENTLIAPPPASAFPVSVVALLDGHAQCHGQTTHDELRLAGKSLDAANRAIRALKLFPREELVLPDLSASGYELAGVCRCDVAPDAEDLHVSYRHRDSGARVSLVVSSRPLTLRSGSAALAESERGGRRYERADLRDRMALAKWDERYCSVVLCSQMPANDLLKLADAIRMFKSGGASLAVVTVQFPPL